MQQSLCFSLSANFLAVALLDLRNLDLPQSLVNFFDGRFFILSNLALPQGSGKPEEERMKKLAISIILVLPAALLGTAG